MKAEKIRKKNRWDKWQIMANLKKFKNKFKTNHSNNDIKCKLYIQFHLKGRNYQTRFLKR